MDTMDISDYEMTFVYETDEKYIEEYEEFLKNYKYSKGNNFEMLYTILGNLKDWVWVGGVNHTGHNGDTFDRGYTYFQKYFNYKKEHPEITNACECGHYITENCWIYNKKEDMILTLGNCCIRRVLGNDYQKNGKAKKCKHCKKEHRNKKTIYCNDCRYMIFCKSCDKDITNRVFCPDCRNCIVCKKPTKGYKYCFKCNLDR